MVYTVNMDTALLDQINQLRLEEDLTYADLGEQIGIDGGALYRILNGQVEPIDRTLFKIRRFIEKREAAKRPARKRAS
jgi:transcriptional regulator with XRE-family HTH domain